MGSLPDIYKKVRWSGITPVADTNEIGIILKRQKSGGKVHRFRLHVEEAKKLVEVIAESLSLAGFPEHSQPDKSSGKLHCDVSDETEHDLTSSIGKEVGKKVRQAVEESYSSGGI